MRIIAFLGVLPVLLASLFVAGCGGSSSDPAGDSGETKPLKPAPGSQDTLSGGDGDSVEMEKPEPEPESPEEPATITRYSIAQGCFALKARDTAALALRDANGGYSLYSPNSLQKLKGTPFFMKPTALGRYLLYADDRTMMAAFGNTVGSTAPDAPADAADWTVDKGDDGAFTLFSEAAGRALAVRHDGRLVLDQAVKGAASQQFDFVPADGCTPYPEITVNIHGEPFKGSGPDAPALGFADAHSHVNNNEYIGGRVSYGRAYHRFGVLEALKDCAVSHGTDGQLDFVGSVMGKGELLSKHDTVGWPSFADWPRSGVTHQTGYYKWLERAWRSGQRLLVNYFVENQTACKVSRLIHQTDVNCNEMDSIRFQAKEIHKLVDYIDAQEGGPGKGWLRIATSPSQARRIINEGKMAMVLGIENSHLFDCSMHNNVPQCDEATIDRQLEEFHGLGIRAVHPVHQYDNALGGAGVFNPNLNYFNTIDTGRFWETETCPDGIYYSSAGAGLLSLPAAGKQFVDRFNIPDSASAVIRALIDAAPVPDYAPDHLHCNVKGMTALGGYLINRLMDKRMIIELDHMSLRMKRQALDIAAARSPAYPMNSSHGGHGGLTEELVRNIFKLGGLIYPYKSDATKHLERSHNLRRLYKESGADTLFAIGIGVDINGLAPQSRPRPSPARQARPLQYPFTLFRGEGWGPRFEALAPMTVEQQVSGERVYHGDQDGGAHYGLLADWVEEVRMEGGEQAINDLYNSAEAWLQMWERTINR